MTENGTLTYTFVIQNFGNVAANAATGAVITDTFDPVLSNLTVTFNGTAWTDPTEYTYDETTGVFATAAGGDHGTGSHLYPGSCQWSWVANPGVSTLVVTGNHLKITESEIKRDRWKEEDRFDIRPVLLFLMLFKILPELGRTHTVSVADWNGKSYGVR